MTRPDIEYALGQVSKYCQNPNKSHWNAVLQIFAYVFGKRIMESGSPEAKIDS
jgi:hypothetical protein